MPEYVQGDDFIEETKFSTVEQGKLHRRISWTGFVAFSVLTLLYAVFGGRGWLALSILSGFSWIVLVLEGNRLDSVFVIGVTENRLRIIEDRTQRISDEQYTLSRHIDPERYPPL